MVYFFLGSELSRLGQKNHKFDYLNKALASILRHWLFFPLTAANNFSFLSLLFPLLPMFCISSLWYFNNLILHFFPFCCFFLCMYVHPSYFPFTNTFFLSLHIPSILCPHFPSILPSSAPPLPTGTQMERVQAQEPSGCGAR